MKVESEVNVRNVKEFYKAVRSELDSNSEVVLDFTDTVRIDSAAAQVIISAMIKAVEIDKKVTITGASPEMSELLKLAGL